VVLDATDLDSPLLVTQRLYKVQYGVINAFLDIFVTENGKAKNPDIVDYYGQDEPIELGPDENMHDAMIEHIAQLSLKRGYILGIGIMSSKRVGINHKEYGVTSRGVFKFAEIAMKEIGINVYADPFSIKFTGGPNGDVAGNSMRLVLERCPKRRFSASWTAQPESTIPRAQTARNWRDWCSKRIWTISILKALHPKGSILFRHQRRQEGVRELYRKVSRSAGGLQEDWITADEFHKEMDDLLFRVPVDLFLPCGGRPETIDADNWHRTF
jgi:glutamate dehydrogenase